MLQVLICKSDDSPRYKSLSQADFIRLRENGRWWLGPDRIDEIRTRQCDVGSPLIWQEHVRCLSTTMSLLSFLHGCFEHFPQFGKSSWNNSILLVIAH